MQQSGFYSDHVQQHAAYMLDKLYEQIIKSEKSDRQSILKYLPFLIKSNNQLRGLYFWGGVGRGKTFLMDIFFQCLPITNKKRFHFHHFMQQIHEELKQTNKGLDPINQIALKVVDNTRVLCLDEFVVNDIADAMLVGRILEVLFSKGVLLVTTSNSPPEQLYKDGLQRANFLPAIDMLMNHCQVSNLDGGTDYRQLGLHQSLMYQLGTNDETIQTIKHYLQLHQVQVSGFDPNELRINGRDIKYEYCAEDTVWFNFDELCKTARSRFDYLEVAKMFSTLVLTGVEHMHDGVHDVARRFISLIDVLYDHRVKLICTADVTIEKLYTDRFLEFEFQRTKSRLLEMQKMDYVGKSHLSFERI